MTTNEDPDTDDEFTIKYTQPGKSDGGAAAQQSIESIADQFIPSRSRVSKGVSEASSVKDDLKASRGDAIRIGVDAAGLALTAATAGAGAAVVAPASTAASTAANAGTSAAVDATASKIAAEAAKAGIAEVAGSAAAKAGAELGKDVGQKLVGETASTVAEAATKEGIKDVVKNGATKQPITDLIGDASKVDGPSGTSGKSRIQDAIDRLNDDSSIQKRVKGDLKNAAKKPDTWKPSKSNSDAARAKNDAAWEDDHRGHLEKSLDKSKELTGIDGLKAVGKTPLVGGILEGSVNIGMRGERHLVKKAKRNIATIASVAGASAFIMFVSLMMGVSGASAPATDNTSCNTDASGSNAPIGGSFALDAAQVGIARTIIGVSKGMFPDATQAKTAAKIALMTTLVETGMRNLSYGDLDSLGLFQQRASWGTSAQRQDPVYSTTKFLARLQTVASWDTIDSGAAAQKVQVSAYPARYAVREPDALSILAMMYDSSPAIAPDPAAGSGTSTTTAPAAGTPAPNVCGGNITVSADKKVLANQLLGMIAAKTLTIDARHLPQIEAEAAGTTTANCGVDAMIMQAIVIAVKTDPPIAVSSINRLCINEKIGAGALSAHYAQGGGHAVDFNFIGGNRTAGINADRGRDPDSLRVIAALYNHFPQKGFALGQDNCNIGHAPISVGLWVQFPDGCTHLHFQDFTAAGRN